VTIARGTFEVKMTPQRDDDKAPGSTLGRLSLEKKFAGDLEGAGSGEMLTAMSEVEGSAGYVAVERITGSLHGRAGSFALQHNGTMARGEPQLTITVVPDSGSGRLLGLDGKFSIKVEEGSHTYEFDYTLPETSGPA
jgi:Protein of unknown function (DUF3224)